MKYLVFVLFFFSLSASGESAEECAKLARTVDRLACFDELFPSQSDSKSQAKMQEEQVVEPAAPMESRENMSDKGSVATVEVDNSRDAMLKKQKTKKEPKGEKKKGFSLGKLLDRDPQFDITTTIKSLKAGVSQKMVFLLANNEVWLQNAPRTLPFREGDTVTIKSGLLGGYIMRSDGGTSTRVQRIK